MILICSEGAKDGRDERQAAGTSLGGPPRSRFQVLQWADKLRLGDASQCIAETGKPQRFGLAACHSAPAGPPAVPPAVPAVPAVHLALRAQPAEQQGNLERAEQRQSGLVRARHQWPLPWINFSVPCYVQGGLVQWSVPKSQL